MMTKNELRKVYKNKRAQLDDQQCAFYDTQILKHLTELDWSSYQYLHVFISLSVYKEPDTSQFINWLTHHHPHIKLVLSKADFIDGVMVNYLWDENTVFEESSWGITEPVNGVQVQDNLVDVVLVPLLVADLKGNRVGYGRGFYDRFLNSCRLDVVPIGISYFDLVDEISDTEVWDYPLRYCITPEKVHRF